MTLIEIKKALPHGAIKEISAKSGIRQVYFSKYFAGTMQDLDGKMTNAIKDYMIELKERKAKIEQTKKEIAELI